MNNISDRSSGVLRIVGVYALFSLIWIFASDTLLDMFVQDPHVMAHLAIFKGSLFVLLTSLLLYFLMNRYNIKLAASQEILKANELNIRTILDTEPECVKMLDAACNLVMMNRAGLEMLEADSFEQVKGHSVVPLITDQFRNAFVALTKQVFQGIPGTLEFEITGLKGHRKWLDTHAVPFRNEQGEIVALLGITRDISERKRTDEELRQKQILLSNLSQQVPGVLFQTIISPDGHTCTPYSSDKLHDIYEVSPEQIREDVAPVIDRFHPEDRDRIIASIKEAAEKLVTWNCDYRVLLPRQGLRWLQGIAETHREADGTVVFYGIIMDITDRKLIEEKLRLSEEKFSTAFRASPDAINITRLSDGLYLEVSEGFTTMTGYTPEDVIGISSLELNIWDNPEDRTRLASCLKEHGVVNNLEANFRRKDGSILTGFMSARIMNIEGESCVLSITRDVTDRKRAEEYLRDSEKNLRTLLDSMPAGVWWFDNDGKVEFLNKCFTEQFGYTLDDIPTLNDWFLRAYPDADYRIPYLAKRNAAIAEARSSGIMVPPREARIICKDGTQLHIIINTQFVLGRTIEIFTDITERELSHDRLQKMEKLESLGVLAGGIAHDFNNILTSIIGNISLARTYLDESHNSSSVLSNAEKAANRAAELAHQLLTFAKGGQPIKRVVSVRHILEESASFVLHGSNVSSSIEIPDDLCSVEVDEGQISQVFNNLFINASQSMPGGGTITVRAENINLSEDNPFSLAAGAYVKLIISDAGCGMSEDVMNRIFDPYFTTKTGGSGLGLASAHSIVIRHGGYIGVSSAVGKGTTFELLLPASTKKASHENTAMSSVLMLKQTGFSVLVMDDEETIREMVSVMLTELGFSSHTCSNGEEAITCYKAACDAGIPYSAVIMDLTIPGGMGGKEAARQILAIDPNARLIVSSGYSSDPIMANHLDFGFCATLQKPYSIMEIMKTLRSSIG